MSRIIRAGEGLSGQTFTTLNLPDGHARQSYFGDCDLRGAAFIGDFRGSDILGCRAEGLDMSQAQSYGCRLDGSTVDGTTVFSPTAGGYQAEVTRELIRRRIPTFSKAAQPLAEKMLIAHTEYRHEDFFRMAAEVEALPGGWDDINGLLLWLQKDHPRIREYVALLFYWATNERNWTVCATWPVVKNLTFPDGAAYELDPKALPAIQYPGYRYELDRLMEDEVGPSTLPHIPARHVWTAAIGPTPKVYHGPTADFWLDPKWQTGTRAWY